MRDTIECCGDDLGRQNELQQRAIDTHAPQGSKAGLILPALSAVPATLRATADLSSLFKTDVGAEGSPMERAGGLFVTAQVRQCPDKVAGLGAGYLGELDEKLYDSLLAKVRNLAAERSEPAIRSALVQRLADAARGADKKELAALAAPCLRVPRPSSIRSGPAKPASAVRCLMPHATWGMLRARATCWCSMSTCGSRA